MAAVREDIQRIKIAIDLANRDVLKSGLAWGFFANGDSREPENAGIRGALIGSLLTILVTLAVAMPLGVAAALYLEEFAPRNMLTGLIEVNINNLEIGRAHV